MNVLLIEPDVKRIAPNLAMMKYATWAIEKGYDYEYMVCESMELEKVIHFTLPKKTPDLVLMSCIFSFYSKEYRNILVHYRRLFPNARFLVGGAFPTLNPQWFKRNLSFVEVHEGTNLEIEDLPPKYSIDPSNKKIVGYASRGCTNACKYCAVSKLEGGMKSFPTIRPMIENGIKEIPDNTGIVLYDNNFTAHQYFDNICNELEEFGLPVDIHGLHVSDFTEHHAERFARLKWGAQHEKGTAYLRFSFDFVGYQKHILRALKLVEKYQIKAGFFCYLLFNWVDSPDDFWNRIVMSQEMVDEVGRSIFLFPQRYEPLDSLDRNKYIGAKWDKELVTGMVRLYTFMHGFLPLTTTHNLFNWIGYTKEEFFDNARKFVKVKHFGLERKEPLTLKK